LLGLPDLDTLRVAAWLPRSAIVLCDAVAEGGNALIEVAPRTILRRQIERAASMGFAPLMASELEFFLFHDDYATAHEKGYRDLTKSQHYVEDYHVLSSAFAEPLIGEIRRQIDASGVPVEFSKGEWGPGQHEINLRYGRALEMADRHVIYKLAAKEIADAAGCSLTFMAKVDESLAGSSCHVHMSLQDADGEPAFPGSGRLAGVPAPVSDTFRWFLGGLLRYSRELTCLFAPNVNSYKRFRPGTFAPTAVAWSYDNRTTGFRVVGRGASIRVESRMPGADVNPYLTYAAMLAAGLEGVDQCLEPEPMFEGDAYGAERLAQLPTNLRDSVAALERSEFARKAFGDEVVDHILHFARTELSVFDTLVTDAERARFFERI
jgi:glutamine synthetase